MSAQGKIPRVFGRQIIDAFLVVKKGNKTGEFPICCSLGHGECEIYSTDWKKCYHTFQIADGRAEMEGDNVIHFEYRRQGQPAEFFMRYDRCDLILNAFAVNQPEKKVGEGNTMTPVSINEILSFGSSLPINLANAIFKPHLEAQARKRVMFLASSSEISDSIVLSIACEFRMRFPHIEPENWTEAFEVLWFEFVAFCVSLWTQCLKAAIEPHTGPNSFEYFRRLAASIASLIAKGADVFQVDRRMFLLAVRKFLDTGDPGEIPATSRALVADVELALGNARKRWLLPLTDLFEFTQLFSAAVAVAQAVSNELKEVRALASMLCSWSISMVNNLIRGPRVLDFRNILEKLSVAVLKANDTKRYNPEFHCTLALWKLAELAKSTEN